MPRVSVSLLIVVLLSGCQPPPPAYRPPPSPNTASVSQKLLHAWVDCVRASYRIDVASIPDKNEAAERAFLACQSEEADFRTSSGASGEMLFPHLKSQVKVVVINDEPF